jgi:hypothetical protein
MTLMGGLYICPPPLKVLDYILTLSRCEYVHLGWLSQAVIMLHIYGEDFLLHKVLPP